MNTVVVFTSNNARIINGVEDVTPFQGSPNSVVNPDLTQVRGVPPHYWKIVDGVIIPMTKSERESRDADHAKNAVDNTVVVIPKPTGMRYINIILAVAAVVVIAVITYLRFK